MAKPPIHEELDANIRDLVHVLNQIPGVRTIVSCGGHAHPTGEQWRAGTWYVKFELDLATDALRWLAWAINNDLWQAFTVVFRPVMPPPYLNSDVDPLWVIECGDPRLSPDDVAAFLRQHVLPATSLPGFETKEHKP
jgi:hypothetical protein